MQKRTSFSSEPALTFIIVFRDVVMDLSLIFRVMKTHFYTISLTVSFVIIENIRRRIGNIVCGIWALGQYIDYVWLLEGWLRL